MAAGKRGKSPRVAQKIVDQRREFDDDQVRADAAAQQSLKRHQVCKWAGLARAEVEGHDRPLQGVGQGGFQDIGAHAVRGHRGAQEGEHDRRFGAFRQLPAELVILDLEGGIA
jgi:hypothetical protein